MCVCTCVCMCSTFLLDWLSNYAYLLVVLFSLLIADHANVLTSLKTIQFYQAGVKAKSVNKFS